LASSVQETLIVTTPFELICAGAGDGLQGLVLMIRSESAPTAAKVSAAIWSVPRPHEMLFLTPFLEAIRSSPEPAVVFSTSRLSRSFSLDSPALQLPSKVTVRSLVGLA